VPVVPVGVLNAPIWHTLAGESISVQSVTGFTAILERSILAVELDHWMPADGRMHGLRGVRFPHSSAFENVGFSVGAAPSACLLGPSPARCTP
jgi:hypothetical protein